MVRVIYKDQTAGVVESHLLDDLISKGRVVAYHSTDRWIPVESNALLVEDVAVRQNYDARRKHN